MGQAETGWVGGGDGVDAGGVDGLMDGLMDGWMGGFQMQVPCTCACASRRGGTTKYESPPAVEENLGKLHLALGSLQWPKGLIAVGWRLVQLQLEVACVAAPAVCWP